MSVVAQLAHLRPTSSGGESIVDHRASLMMKDAEPQVWQANAFAVSLGTGTAPSDTAGHIPAEYMLPHSSGREGRGVKFQDLAF